MKTSSDVLAALDLTPAKEADPLHLGVGSVGVTVLCPDPLRSVLAEYFSEALSETPGSITVDLLPGQTLAPEPDWVDWQREPGKTGRKDAIFDLDDARLIRKVRSDVSFLQAPNLAVAWGPIVEHESTVINFINTQILNACLRQAWQLCHAAAVSRNGRMLAISGLSGGGKSTSILRMMDIERTQFVSNDRLLVHPGNPTRALGIPKHPRINPGTILGNPRLHGILTAERRAALSAMDAQALWSLEDKHDLIVSEIYGPDRVSYEGILTDFWVLNWNRESSEPMRVSGVTLLERPDLLSAIMKSPGPFYQDADGTFEPNGNNPNPDAYLEALQSVRVCEVSGRIDFDALADVGRKLFDG